MSKSLPDFCPHRLPNVRINRWQAGVLKLMGKVHPSLWQLLWLLAETADDNGKTDVGRSAFVFRYQHSHFLASKWLRTARDTGWFTEQTNIVPIKVNAAGGGRPIDRRKYVTKILNPCILKGEPVPGYEMPAFACQDIRKVFKSCMRRKGYYYLIRYSRELQLWVRRVELYDKAEKKRNKRKRKKKRPCKSKA